MSNPDQIGQWKPLLAGEEKTLTLQFDDELAAGETLTGTPTVTVSVVRGTDPAPAALILQTSFDAATRNILLRVKGLVRSVEYEIRVLVTTSAAGHTPGRAGRIYVQ
jgi:hypothetical protein